MSKNKTGATVGHNQVCVGTIFDQGLGPIYKGDPIRRQRVNGLFFAHGINPNAVVGDSVWVYAKSPGADEVRVDFGVIMSPDGQWAGGTADEAPFPAGVVCCNGGTYSEPHKAASRGSFKATWAEVAL